jgi:hypothetical protein
LPPWAALGGPGVACRQLITDAYALAEVDVDAGTATLSLLSKTRRLADFGDPDMICPHIIG